MEGGERDEIAERVDFVFANMVSNREVYAEDIEEKFSRILRVLREFEGVFDLLLIVPEEEKEKKDHLVSGRHELVFAAVPRPSRASWKGRRASLKFYLIV